MPLSIHAVINANVESRATPSLIVIEEKQRATIEVTN